MSSWTHPIVLYRLAHFEAQAADCGLGFPRSEALSAPMRYMEPTERFSDCLC